MWCQGGALVGGQVKSADGDLRAATAAERQKAPAGRRTADMRRLTAVPAAGRHALDGHAVVGLASIGVAEVGGQPVEPRGYPHDVRPWMRTRELQGTLEGDQLAGASAVRGGFR